MITKILRPGYFGRARDQKIAEYNSQLGEGKWELRWFSEGSNGYTFEQACKLFYELSYSIYLTNSPGLLEWICSFGECMDNAITNIDSGIDYLKQEAFSTHIQDIAVRNVLNNLGLSFKGAKDNILVIRGPESNGSKLNPGQIPFFKPEVIGFPSLAPKWAKKGSVEDFWQSNKWLVSKEE